MLTVPWGQRVLGGQKCRETGEVAGRRREKKKNRLKLQTGRLYLSGDPRAEKGKAGQDVEAVESGPLWSKNHGAGTAKGVQ